MADRRSWPDSWPDAAFFGIGAALGFGLALLTSLIIPLRISVAIPVVCAAAVVLGFLGVVFREDLFFLLPPWN